jgi:hypothetical protein
MREIDHQESGSPLRFKPWFIILVGSVCLLVGVSIGRAFFPLEVPKPFIVEKEKRVEVPFEVVKYVDRTVLSDRTPQVPFPKAPTISSTAIDAASWKKLSVGMSPESVRNLLGAPKQVGGSSFFYQWYYDDTSSLSFVDDKLHNWSTLSR